MLVINVLLLNFSQRVIGIICLNKLFSMLYRRQYALILKFNFRLNSLLNQGLSEPEFYGDLVYRLKKIMGRTEISDNFETLQYVTNVLAMI